MDLSDCQAATQERSISDVAATFAVSLRTLRFYEQKGLVKPRRDGHKRIYGTKDMIRVELILKGRKLGFTLYEIERILKNKAPDTFVGNLSEPEISAQLVHLEEQRSNIDKAIDDLREAARRLKG